MRGRGKIFNDFSICRAILYEISYWTKGVSHVVQSHIFKHRYGSIMGNIGQLIVEPFQEMSEILNNNNFDIFHISIFMCENLIHRTILSRSWRSPIQFPLLHKQVKLYERNRKDGTCARTCLQENTLRFFSS